MSVLPVRGLSLVLVAVLVTVGGTVLAQPVSSARPQPPGSAYYVWGQVRAPGAYNFVANPDILELLSAGGGPTENASLTNVALIRALDQRRTTVDLRAMLASGQVIRLAPGDVVIVPTSGWYQVRNWFSVVTVASTLATLTLTIVNLVGT